MEPDDSINVEGGPLALCGNGHCNTCAADQGSHTVCAVMTAEFLAFSKYVGNDLSTPNPAFGFAGLKPGDPWCLWRWCHWTSSKHTRWTSPHDTGALRWPVGRAHRWSGCCARHPPAGASAP